MKLEQNKILKIENTMLRRSFLKQGTAWAGIGCISQFGFTAENVELTTMQRRSLLAALKKADQNYDPEVKMIKSHVSSVGYHTTLDSGVVHQTRGSLQYAAALLASGVDWRIDRAKEILDTVIALQDQDPASRTYGIWSWYLEEPLDVMSPPDWNWADFCGVQLLYVWIHHRDEIGEKLASKVKDSILHAARSIQKRNVGPGYTNIAVMGTYMTLVVSDRFGLKEMQEYAKKRLRRFYEHTMSQGSFSEYNSPTYSIVAIAELSRMFLHVRDEEDLRLIREITDLAWKHVATHFHPPTKQWAGPHSRCYSTDLRQRGSTLAFLEMATHGKAEMIDEDPLPMSMDYCRLPLNCPDRFVHYFTTLKEPREVIETFSKSDKPVIGVTYLHPKYALGTVNQGDFWRQKRSFLAYWGTQENPTYLHARFLHDHYDFCSALIYTVQSREHALSSVVFATDYGDTHPSLDRVKNATIQAKDLRLRFEIGAEIDNMKVTEKKDTEIPTYEIRDRDMLIELSILTKSFGDFPIRCETGFDSETSFIDLICYEGDERSIDFSGLSSAYLAFSMQMKIEGESRPLKSASAKIENKQLSTFWNIGDRTLQLHVPTKPNTRKNIRKQYEGKVV